MNLGAANVLTSHFAAANENLPRCTRPMPCVIYDIILKFCVWVMQLFTITLYCVYFIYVSLCFVSVHLLAAKESVMLKWSCF